MARSSITKRGDVYTVRYDVPSATGRRKQARRSFPTLKAAERFLASTITAIDRGDVVASTGETFAEYAPRWLSEHRAHVEHATAIDYDNALRNHLLPYFGSTRLDKITAESIRKSVAGKLDGTAAVREQPDGKGGRITTKLSPKTINNQVTTLGLILGHAVEDRLIARNPAERRGSRRSLMVKVPHRERDYLRAAEVPAYLDACSAFWRPRALALILTGMRMGELLALRWEDVDWHGRAVIVHRAPKRDGAIGSTRAMKRAGGSMPRACCSTRYATFGRPRPSMTSRSTTGSCSRNPAEASTRPSGFLTRSIAPRSSAQGSGSRS